MKRCKLPTYKLQKKSLNYTRHSITQMRVTMLTMWFKMHKTIRKGQKMTTKSPTRSQRDSESQHTSLIMCFCLQLIVLHRRHGGFLLIWAECLKISIIISKQSIQELWRCFSLNHQTSPTTAPLPQIHPNTTKEEQHITDLWLWMNNKCHTYIYHSFLCQVTSWPTTVIYSNVTTEKKKKTHILNFHVSHPRCVPCTSHSFKVPLIPLTFPKNSIYTISEGVSFLGLRHNTSTTHWLQVCTVQSCNNTTACGDI